MITEKTLLGKDYDEHYKKENAHLITGCKCDICGESCVPKGTCNVAEFMKLKAHWGYDSSHDLEIWTAEVCEKCVTKHLEPLIKFRKRDLDIWTGAPHEKEDEGVTIINLDDAGPKSI